MKIFRIRWWSRLFDSISYGIKRRFGRFLGGIWATARFFTWPIRGTIQWLVQGWQRSNFRNLLFGIPAILALVGAGILWAAANVNARTVTNSYLDRARSAIDKKDYKSAEVYLQRLIDTSSSNSNQAQFDLGEVFENTDRPQRAMSIFNKLAPNDRRGYPPAHRKQAVFFAEQLNSQSTGDDIRLVRHHLTHSDGQRTPIVARAWASYYLALNQAEPAIERLEEAVREFPELSLLLGNLYLSTGEMENAKASFTNASEFLRERVEKDPYNRAARVTFADTLLKLGELDECRAVLELGMKLDPDGPYKQLLASLFTNRHDMMAQEKGAPVSVLLTALRQALNYDPTFAPAYERLVSYGTATVDGGGDLSEILADVIAQGEEPGLAHFAMSILKWKQNDVESARFHLERAYRLTPDMPFVANNLAWILATEEPSDVPRALEILEPAAQKYPNEPRLQDTYGTILMKLDRWNDALDKLERALINQQKPDQRIKLHEKLAEVYDHLKQPQLAEKHRAYAQGAPESPVPLTPAP
ncbi:MAG: tetratricopeptide repeat protein [Planctomycetaceae bacterium]|nr:tetratricopeptide repeat protein [Planctomycetaceae bacterium]